MVGISTRAGVIVRAAGLLFVAIALSACVSSVSDGLSTQSVSQSLDDAGISENQELQTTSLEGEPLVGEGAASFVPTKAPRSSSAELKIAAVSNGEVTDPASLEKPPVATDENAATSPVKETVKKIVEKTETATIKPPETSKPKPVKSAKQTTTTDTQRTAALKEPDAVPVASTSGQKSQKKLSFFQKLFLPKPGSKSAQPIKKRITTRPKIVLARSNHLPGVKSNSKLFGIRNEAYENGIQIASVGNFGRLSPNGLRVQHSKVRVNCFKPELLRILKIVERKYGRKPLITSGYRSPKRNRRAGGASNSQHIYCKAADFQIEGVSKWALAKYLRSIPGRGGVGTYCRTKSVHIDVGSKRDWHHPCRRSVLRRKRKA